MPKVRADIKNLELHRRTTTIEDKYPWLRNIQDGRVHELVLGKDFTTRTETLRSGLKKWAKRNSLPLVISSEGKNLLVQVVKTAPAKRKTRKR